MYLKIIIFEGDFPCSICFKEIVRYIKNCKQILLYSGVRGNA